MGARHRAKSRRTLATVWLLAVALVLSALHYWTSKGEQGSVRGHAAEQVSDGSANRGVAQSSMKPLLSSHAASSTAQCCAAMLHDHEASAGATAPQNACAIYRDVRRRYILCCTHTGKPPGSTQTIFVSIIAYRVS
jgi:hypothetical protein